MEIIEHCRELVQDAKDSNVGFVVGLGAGLSFPVWGVGYFGGEFIFTPAQEWLQQKDKEELYGIGLNIGSIVVAAGTCLILPGLFVLSEAEKVFNYVVSQYPQIAETVPFLGDPAGFLYALGALVIGGNAIGLAASGLEHAIQNHKDKNQEPQVKPKSNSYHSRLIRRAAMRRLRNRNPINY